MRSRSTAWLLCGLLPLALSARAQGTADDGDAVKSLAKRFSTQPRKGPMAVPSVKIVVGDLLANRSHSIPMTDPLKLIAPIAPPP